MFHVTQGTRGRSIAVPACIPPASGEGCRWQRSGSMFLLPSPDPQPRRCTSPETHGRTDRRLVPWWPPAPGSRPTSASGTPSSTGRRDRGEPITPKPRLESPEAVHADASRSVPDRGRRLRPRRRPGTGQPHHRRGVDRGPQRGAGSGPGHFSRSQSHAPGTLEDGRRGSRPEQGTGTMSPTPGAS